MRILFCIPAYGGSVRVETMLAVASGVMHMKASMPNIEVELFSIDLAEISRVRNLFASVALERNFDVLLMLDSDMGVPSDTFTRLVMSPYEVCGLTYPKREIDLNRFHKMAVDGADLETCRIGSLTFICADAFVHNKGQIEVKESFLEMKELPGGCLMIRNSALKRLWQKMPDIRQTQHVNDIEGKIGLTRIIRCFDNIQNGNTKCSEDISFCRRWTSIGGKLHALFDVPVAHFGHMKFDGAYSANLMARATNVAPLLA